MLALACLAPSARRACDLPGENGKSSFSADLRAGNPNLLTINADGSGERPRIVRSTDDDVRHPSWSWDGANLAFASVSSMPRQSTPRFPMAARRRILTTYRFGHSSTLHGLPPVARVAFDSRNDFRIHILEVGTTNEQTLVPGEDPAWSPDGSQSPSSTEIDEIWTVGSRRQLCHQPHECSGVRSVPRLVPRRVEDRLHARRAGRGLLRSMSWTPTGRTRPVHLHDPAAVNQSPSWSPDGSRIAFASDLDGDYEIYTMLADGSDIQQVTDNPARDDDPAWQPLPPSVTGFYPRPAGATPIRASLVTAFQACVSPNRTHGPPLAIRPAIRRATTRRQSAGSHRGFA